MYISNSEYYNHIVYNFKFGSMAPNKNFDLSNDKIKILYIPKESRPKYIFAVDIYKFFKNNCVRPKAGLTMITSKLSTLQSSYAQIHCL